VVGQPSDRYPAKDAWFRSSDWDEAAQAEFHKRLARARPQSRSQYRRLKAGRLLASGSRDVQEAGRRLLDDVIADPTTYEFERVSAHSALAAHSQAVGDLGEAERQLRLVFETRVRAHGSGGSNLDEVRFAEVLLSRGGRARLEEALALLESKAAEPVTFMATRFRTCLAGVRVSLALNDKRHAASWANEALKVAAATHSGLRNHPHLGLVETDAGTMRWLTTLAAGSAKSSQ
jgi:hypothetical protein